MAPTSPKWGQYWILSLLPHIDLGLRQGAKPLAVPGSKKWYRQTSHGLSYTETCWVAAGLGTISPDSYAGPAHRRTTAEHVLVLSRTRVQVMPRSCMHDTSVQNRSDACTSPKPWRCDVFDTSKRKEPCHYRSLLYIINTRARNVHSFVEIRLLRSLYQR